MYQKVLLLGRLTAASLLLLNVAANATILPRLSFEELTDSSELVVSGTISRSWAAWDAAHKYIWTHYELSVASSSKGAPGATVEFAEPGGMLNGVLHAIVGSVAYRPGENVVVFLQRMPNGYLRTTGWGQGKYTLDQNQKLSGGAALRGVDLVAMTGRMKGATSLDALNGISLSQLSARVSTRVQATRQLQRSK